MLSTARRWRGPNPELPHPLTDSPDTKYCVAQTGHRHKPARPSPLRRPGRPTNRLSRDAPVPEFERDGLVPRRAAALLIGFPRELGRAATPARWARLRVLR